MRRVLSSRGDARRQGDAVHARQATGRIGDCHRTGQPAGRVEHQHVVPCTQQDLDPVRSGDAQTITFINTTQQNHTIFLPVVVRH